MQTGQTQDAVKDVVTTVKPFQIRGRFFTAVALRLEADADQAFFDALDGELRRMPHFFDSAPFVIDLELCPGLVDSAEIEALIAGLKRRSLSVFGIQNATPEQAAIAEAAGLLTLPSGRDAPLDRVDRQKRPTAKALPKKPVIRNSLIINEPVRSGQKLFADRGDLVVVASVSSGAELVAAGNIHVYGQLRGRALAGVNGDTTARIFCHSLNAELLAVAGLYLTSEDLDPDLLRQPVQVFLQDDKLRVSALG